MSFADNLQSIRKEKKLSQEELAERIGVSRQAVSKWEQGGGYPETEKLLLLSQELNISLDYLMMGEMRIPETNKSLTSNFIIPTGKITIKSYDGKSIANCYKVLASHVMYTARIDEPSFWLIGVNSGAFWGEQSIVLGWLKWLRNNDYLNNNLNNKRNRLR